MKIEIIKSIDDIETFIKLIDELICGTKSYEILKKLFWHVNIKETKYLNYTNIYKILFDCK
jgi:hypothetical protein